MSAVKQAPMTGVELLAEVEWLLDGGMHPEVIAAQLGRKVASIYTLAWKRGNERVQQCPCGSQASQWAYQHDDPNERRSVEGAYSPDPDRYTAMCVPCHKRYDLDLIRRTA